MKMKWKFCANAAFFGPIRSRFAQYQPKRTLAEKFALVAKAGVEGIELKYPFDFQDTALVKQLLQEHGLSLPVVNVDTKDIDHFRFGALSAQSAQARKHAVKLLTEGMDIAAEFGAEMISTCPLADGYDYPFQIDYSAAWEHFIDTVRTAASHRTDVKLLLEYQPHDPHAKIMLNNVGKALHVCAETDAPNVGVNLDIGHSFAAGEAPAEAAALLAAKGLLCYIHTNDNTGEGGDWDMLSGSVHFWHWLELLHTLDRVGYTGWLGGDIMAKQMSPDGAFRTNFLLIRRMINMLEQLGSDKLTELIETDGSTAETYDFLSSLLAPEPGESK